MPEPLPLHPLRVRDAHWILRLNYDIMSVQEKHTIVVVEDHALIRELWMQIFSGKEGLEVVSGCADGATAMEAITANQPDLVSLDINLGDTSGFELVSRIRSCSPLTKIIVVSMHVQQNYLREMLRLGVEGYVTKSSSYTEILAAVDAVLAGRTYVCTEMRPYLDKD